MEPDLNFNNNSEMDQTHDMVKKMTPEELSEFISKVELSKEEWRNTQRLVKACIDLGLEEIIKSGTYSSAPVREALALLKQAEKPFDESQAASILENLDAFNQAAKGNLDKHKSIASTARN